MSHRGLFKFMLTISIVTVIPVLNFAQQLSNHPHWTIDDILKQESLGAIEISPDGKWVVWEKQRPDKEEDKLTSDLYISSMTDSNNYQLTRGKFNDRSPKWSPDSKKIAFLSARTEKKGAQIWLMNAFGGEPEELTTLEKGVRAFAWRTNGDIIFTAEENPTLLEQEMKEKKDDSQVVGDQEHYNPVRLFSLNLKSKEIKRLSTNQGQIVEFAISPDGKLILTNENQSIHYRYDFKIPPKQFLYNLEDSAHTEIFTDPHLDPFGYVWMPDSRGFYCSRAKASDSTDTYVSVNALYYYDLVSQKLHKVKVDWPFDLGGDYHITQSGLLTEMANGVYNRLAFFNRDDNGWKREWLNHKDEKNLTILNVGKDGKAVVYAYSTASVPDKIFRGTIQGDRIEGESEFIFLNKWMQKKSFAKSEVLTWKGALGEEIEGLLYYPQNFESGKKYPLVTMIHGGPSGVDRDLFVERWSRNPNIWTSKGAFVLRVNYHGSGNYGMKWVESIKGNYYDLEVPDILNGIDFVIGKGLADADKLGILGWSNGAILAIQACIVSDRFKVLAAGAGDVNWTSDYGNCAFGAGFDNAYFGGPPWEIPQVYINKSPFFKMDKLLTPTIIFFGTEDVNVPTQQGWEHYRAMQQIDKAPVRFILFPGEPHGLQKISHQRRKMAEEVAWFDKYLFETYDAPNEALKKKSLLAWHIMKGKHAKTEGKYGNMQNGALVPETVECEGKKVGRFEVTQAQFRAFRSYYTIESGQENFPAHDISFNDAVAYCRWLSEKTGKTYRLPTFKEMEKLQKLAKENLKNENNLERWLGYSPNPDEVEMIRPKLAEAEKAGTLLMEAGACPPAGKFGVYDLAGNVAEWCADTNLSGKVLGLSAISPAENRNVYSPPPRKYVGFRVVVE